MLVTLGGASAIFAALVYIACSSASGFGLLSAVLVALLTIVLFIAAIAMLVMPILLGLSLFEVLVPNEEVQKRVYLCLRWIVLIMGLGTVLYLGVPAIIDGLRNNRLATADVLYERCMEPQWRTLHDKWQQCADGWQSHSIGRRGACSHHGGVVWRTIERRVQSQPNDAACRANALARSWMD
ncbi:hypothetical protein IPC70_09145 [Pseudomonas aeruginosa]|uniref:hypothetical protein n=1 Tax=Pseudomonas aeruginosa TaxID=287 RepID=UPI00106758D8|nr:hypothetical protein [Pseudomonas aeruginosa]TEP82022.1 hypothetical protein IPC70_09145 [Pseudomonas aeruginosa]